jgi:hypothetical protein
MEKTKSQTIFREVYNHGELMPTQANQLLNSHNMTQSNNSYTCTSNNPNKKRVKMEEINEFNSGNNNYNFCNANNSTNNCFLMNNNTNTGSIIGLNGIQTPLHNLDDIYSNFDYAGQFYNHNINNMNNYQLYGNYVKKCFN